MWLNGTSSVLLQQLLILLILTPGYTTSVAAVPVAGGSSPINSIADANAAIAAQAEAAVAAGQPAKWLVTFQVSELQVDSQAQAVQQAAGIDMPAVNAKSIARRQVYNAVKSKVLVGPSPSSNIVAERAVAQASQQVLQGPVRVLEDYSHLPITFVSVSSASELARLRADPSVLSVKPDGIVRTMGLEGSLKLIGQPATAAKGFTGAGSIAVIDTGLDYTRPVFGPCTAPGVPADTCKVAHAADIADDDATMDDGVMHGTNVAGIIATVAPGTKLIGLDVFGPDGGATWSDVISAVNWALTNKDKYNITAINLSLGGGSNTGRCDDHPLAEAVNSAFAQGIIPVAAAGNEGTPDALLVPACASKAVSVGAVYPDTNPGTPPICPGVSPRADVVACFSNSASFLSILAPGVSITAAGVTMSGTSQATPFVSAAVSALSNRYPNYTPGQIVSVLTSTGTPVTDPRNGITKPRLNLRAALGISCTPQVSPSSLKVANTGGSFTLNVSPPSADCTWTVSTPAASWLRVVGPASGTGMATVTLQVEPVEGADAGRGTARSTGVAVATSEGSAAVLVSQAVLAAAAADTDTRPPVIGRLRGSSSSGSVTLVWPAAQDIGSGVSAYKVVYRTGARAPSPRCITGTPVEQPPVTSGSNLQLTVSGLAAGTRYSFRVCALDAAGNVSMGSLWRGAAGK